ncbi:iron ABC transporter permease [Apibacter raozihei]|uniref:FecCD family ABC transporter permease n=1 Tax=Apibacter raozihei TaxID=2500547 RepID=UPI000FE40734
MNFKYKNVILLIFLLLFFVLSFILSFTIGRYPISVTDILTYTFTGKAEDENLPLLLFEVRLPRVIGAVIAGGALSVSGAAYQGLFRNPMVSPDILGVSSGAGFGASLAILLSLSAWAIQFSAFIAGLFSVLLAVFLSRYISMFNNRILILVLSGMIISSIFGSLISLLKYIADTEYKLPDITFWLMGSLSEITVKEIKTILPIVSISLIPLFLVSWKLNILSLGEEEAQTLGINTSRLRLVVIYCASLLTASIVSVAGLIGWIGLIIPHMTRFITGPNHRILLPASFLLGGTFLLWIDNLSRSISSLEIPLTIITSLIGAPLFFVLLKFSSRNAW